MTWRPPSGVLAELVAAAREDCAARRRQRPSLENEVLRRPGAEGGFLRALRERRSGFPLICEVKRASPSAGAIRADADAPAQARVYESAGATCISVLTEGRRFGGSLADLRAARAAVALPLLRKDFVVEPYMIAEAAEAGANAVLLIAGALEPQALKDLALCAKDFGLDALVEVVHPHELDSLALFDPPLVGVNARDLESLQMDPARFGRLAPKLAAPGRILVAESGVRTPPDIAAVAAFGAGAALVGEALMRASNPAALLRSLAEAA